MHFWTGTWWSVHKWKFMRDSNSLFHLTCSWTLERDALSFFFENLKIHYKRLFQKFFVQSRPCSIVQYATIAIYFFFFLLKYNYHCIHINCTTVLFNWLSCVTFWEFIQWTMANMVPFKVIILLGFKLWKCYRYDKL